MGRIVGQTLTLSLVYKIPYRRARTWPSSCFLAERAREKRYLAYNPNPDLNPDFNPNHDLNPDLNPYPIHNPNPYPNERAKCNVTPLVQRGVI